MELVPSFVELVQQVAPVFTVPTFNSFVTVLTGWVFARRRVVTRMIEAADAVETKHHSAFHRLFAAARWSRDELGLAILGLIQPWLGDGAVLLSLDDTLARLTAHGIGHEPVETYNDGVRHVVVLDPDGNSLSLAEAPAQ